MERIRDLHRVGQPGVEHLAVGAAQVVLTERHNTALDGAAAVQGDYVVALARRT